MDPIQKLPLELVAEIALYVNAIDIWRLRTVSRAWNNALSASAVINHAVTSFATHRIEDSAREVPMGSTNDRALHFKALYTGLPYAILDRPPVRSGRISNLIGTTWYHTALKGAYFAYSITRKHVCLINLVTGESRVVHFQQPILIFYITVLHLLMVDENQDLHLVALDDVDSVIVVKKGNDTYRLQAIATYNHHMLILRTASHGDEFMLLNCDTLDKWYTSVRHALPKAWPDVPETIRRIFFDSTFCYVVSMIRGPESKSTDQIELRVERYQMDHVRSGRLFQDVAYVKYTTPADFVDYQAFETNMLVTNTGVANEWHIHYRDYFGYHQLLLHVPHGGVSVCLLSNPYSNDALWKGVAYQRYGDERDEPTYTMHASAVGRQKTTSLMGVINGRTSTLYHNKGVTLLVNDSFLVDFTYLHRHDTYGPDFTVYAFDPALITGPHQKLQHDQELLQGYGIQEDPSDAVAHHLLPTDRQHEYLFAGLQKTDSIKSTPAFKGVWMRGAGYS